MEKKIIEIIEKVSGYEELTNNLEIDLLDNEILDSLAFIELITELENEFDIEIQPTQVDPNVWRSVKEINKLVCELIK